MWRVTYLNLTNDEIEHKGGFSNDKRAIEWMDSKESNQEIIPLKLLVWSEYLQCYRTVLDFS